MFGANQEEKMSEEEAVAAAKTEEAVAAAKTEEAPLNELLFRKGDEIEINDVEFIVKEVKGIDIILSRKDFK